MARTAAPPSPISTGRPPWQDTPSKRHAAPTLGRCPATVAEGRCRLDEGHHLSGRHQHITIKADGQPHEWSAKA